jgi:signal transduction histidine kinase
MRSARLTTLLPFLAATLLAMVVGLLGLVGFVDDASSRLAEREREIVDDMVPTILCVNQATVDLSALEVMLRDRLSGVPVSDEAIRAKKAAIDADIDGYLALPLAPHEVPVYFEIQRNKASFDGTFDRIATPPRGGNEALDMELRSELDVTAHTLQASLLQAGSVNADAARRTVVVIGAVRHKLLPGAIALEFACIVAAALALGAAYWVARIASSAAEHARTSLEQQAAELDAFSARVAHDVLAPLQGVSLALALAERKLHEDALLERSAVRRAQATLDRLARMCGDLLRFARAGAAPVVAERSEPAVVLAGVIEDLAPIAEQAGVTIVSAVDALPPVRCAAGVLASIASNLVRNAIQHGAGTEASRVTVRATNDHDFVSFEVEDSGPGIPPEEHASVFEPYVRGKGARVTGLGLGLATVKRLVDANGGVVGVVSEPGKGARFWFTLPVA